MRRAISRNGVPVGMTMWGRIPEASTAGLDPCLAGERVEIAWISQGALGGLQRDIGRAGDSREEAGCQIGRELWREEGGRASKLARINRQVGCFERSFERSLYMFIQTDVGICAFSIGDTIGTDHGVCLVGFERCVIGGNVVGIMIVACDQVTPTTQQSEYTNQSTIRTPVIPIRRPSGQSGKQVSRWSPATT